MDNTTFTVNEFLELSRKLLETKDQIAQNQEQALGRYKADQMFGNCPGHFPAAITEAWSHGKRTISLQCLDSDSQAGDSVKLCSKTITIQTISIFGKQQSEWFCCLASWDDGGFIGKAVRLFQERDRV